MARKGVAGFQKFLLDGGKITTDEILCQGKGHAGLYGNAQDKNPAAVLLLRQRSLL